MTDAEMIAEALELHAKNREHGANLHRSAQINDLVPRLAALHQEQANKLAELERILGVTEKHIASLQGEGDDLRAKLAVAREALDRMIRLYESEHDDAAPYRPKWLTAALRTIEETK